MKKFICGFLIGVIIFGAAGFAASYFIFRDDTAVETVAEKEDEEKKSADEDTEKETEKVSAEESKVAESIDDWWIFNNGIELGMNYDDLRELLVGEVVYAENRIAYEHYSDFMGAKIRVHFRFEDEKLESYFYHFWGKQEKEFYVKLCENLKKGLTKHHGDPMFSDSEGATWYFEDYCCYLMLSCPPDDVNGDVILNLSYDSLL